MGALDAVIASRVSRRRVDNTAQLRLANESMIPLIFNEMLSKAVEVAGTAEGTRPTMGANVN